jgi:hypothetical protein
MTSCHPDLQLSRAYGLIITARPFIQSVPDFDKEARHVLHRA